MQVAMLPPPEWRTWHRVIALTSVEMRTRWKELGSSADSGWSVNM
jgi:hypothetical protein